MFNTLKNSQNLNQIKNKSSILEHVNSLHHIPENDDVDKIQADPRNTDRQ
jgi:hypothetical protein